MTNTFVPYKAEKMVIVEISAKEAHLIKSLRSHEFGQFVVHKANGMLVRLEIKDSQLLDEEAGLDIAISKPKEV